jgi:AcrR family transcriptional regulator
MDRNIALDAERRGIPAGDAEEEFVRRTRSRDEGSPGGGATLLSVTETKAARTGSGGRGARRAALVTAAMDLFSRRPYDDIFIDEIAQTAGVAHGLLFYHFKDKRGLYLEVLSQVVDEIVALHEPADGEDTPEQRLRGVLRRLIEYRCRHVYITLALIHGGSQDPEIEALVERARRAGVVFILDLVGIGEPLPSRLRVVMRGCMGLVDEMTVDWLAHDSDLNVDDLVELGLAAVVALLSTVYADQMADAGIIEKLGPTT